MFGKEFLLHPSSKYCTCCFCCYRFVAAGNAAGNAAGIAVAFVGADAHGAADEGYTVTAGASAVIVAVA